MRLLIYGFGPYKQFKENITARVLKKLPETKGVKKVIFPVRFQQRQFIEALKKHKPEIILGLGQTSRSKRIKIERRAVNRRRENKGDRARPIRAGGRKWLATNLRWNGGRQARQSNSAGDYVCNYSMYVILDYLKRRALPARFGFIHMPHDYNLRSARRYVLNLVRGLQVFSG
jgi:pyrrolidone-carboxylate peptidase